MSVSGISERNPTKSEASTSAMKEFSLKRATATIRPMTASETESSKLALWFKGQVIN